MALSTIAYNGLTSPLGGSIINSGTVVAATSGTAITFSSIPSWVKRITVMWSAVTTSGTSNMQIQIGSGSVANTGYVSYGAYAGTSNAAGGSTSTSGFVLEAGAPAAGSVRYGSAVLTLVSSSSNLWNNSSVQGLTTGGTNYYANMAGGGKTLSGAIDRVVLTTVGGTDTFTAGSVNILYE